MKIERLDLYRYRLPLTEPLSLKGATLREREGLLLKLTSDGDAEGWGEAAPLPGFSVETLAEAIRCAQSLQPSLPGQRVTADARAPDSDVRNMLEADALPPSLHFGLELAVWNLRAATQDQTLPALLAPDPRPVVALNGLITASDDLARQGRQLQVAGYRAVKLKVGRTSLGEDIRRVRTLRNVLGPTIALRLDANRAWALDDACAFADAVAGCGIAYIEEPLARPEQMPAFAEDSAVPVALDESLMGLSAEDLSEHTYAHAVVLKPTLLGGLSRTLRLARRARSLGMTPVVSAAFEAGVGMRGLVALAASLGDAPAGLTTYRRLADDVVAPPLPFSESAIDVAALFGRQRSMNQTVLDPL